MTRDASRVPAPHPIGLQEATPRDTDTARSPTTTDTDPPQAPRPQSGAHKSGTREFRAMLSAALEAIPSAAFLLTSAGVLLEVNGAGKECLDRDETRAAALRQALGGRPPADLVITRISGGSGAFLLVHRDTRRGPRPRVAPAASPVRRRTRPAE